jgi:hypothetical protein
MFVLLGPDPFDPNESGSNPNPGQILKSGATIVVITLMIFTFSPRVQDCPRHRQQARRPALA